MYYIIRNNSLEKLYASLLVIVESFFLKFLVNRL